MARVTHAIQNAEEVAVGTHKGTLYRRGELQESSYFVRYFLKEERRYFRKSLHTQDVTKARLLAQNALAEVLGKVAAGQRVISISLGDLRQKYLLELQSSTLAERTKALNVYRVDRGIRFLIENGISLDTRVSSIDGQIFKGYEDFRRAEILEKNKTAKKEIKLRNDVIRDELISNRLDLFKKHQSKGN